MIILADGRFIDTNIVFDAIYTTRPLYSNFRKTFGNSFLLKKLCITLSTDTEVHIIATKSIELLSTEIYNVIRPLDWDSLDADAKDKVIKEIQNNLEANKEVKKKDLMIFVVGALKTMTSYLQSFNKTEIIMTLCPNLLYYYTRELQKEISEHFGIPPADGSHANYNSLKSTIKKSNESCIAFELTENQDFDILSDLILLVELGARYVDNVTQDFDIIDFYSRDGDFKKNFDEFKVYFSNKNEKDKDEMLIADALGKIVISKPY